MPLLFLFYQCLVWRQWKYSGFDKLRPSKRRIIEPEIAIKFVKCDY